jgi:hypothetical protein
MDTKIDGVFEYKSYRYIPYNLRNEWKTLYNIYSRKFYKNMHNRNHLFAQIRIDYYNEELLRFNMLEEICNKFEPKVINLKSKYINEKEYSENIKKSILNSLRDIKRFIKINKNLINNKIHVNDIPLKNNIEHYNDSKCHNLDAMTSQKTILIISLLLIIITFYLTFDNE